MHNIILSNIISNYTIHHIKSSNIIKWLTVIQTKRERKSITKRNTNRLREWKKETKKRTRIRVGVRDKMKTLEKRKKEKTEIYQKYVFRGDSKINKMKK